jgi:hypothetical protein
MSDVEKLHSMVAALAAKVGPEGLPEDVKQLLAARAAAAPTGGPVNNNNHNINLPK